MTRTLKMLATTCLGALLFTSAGCEDKEAQEALKTCRNDLGAEQKTATSQRATIDSLKTQLAQSEAKVQELTKASETTKTEKGSKTVEEKGKTEEAKKAEHAKAEKKAAKK